MFLLPDWPQRQRLHPGWWAVVAVGLSVGTGAVLVSFAGLQSTIAVVEDLRTSWLVLGIGVQLAGLGCLGQVYRTTHRVVGGHVSYGQGLGTALAAFALTQTLPGGGAAGGALTVRRLTQTGTTPVTAFHTVFHLAFVSLAALSLVVTTATGAVAMTTGRYVPHALMSLAGTLAIASAFLTLRWFGAHPGARRRVLGRLERLRWRGQALPSRWLTELRTRDDPLVAPRQLAAPLAWATGKWTADVIVLSLALLAAGGSFSLVVVAVSYGIANVLNTVPLTPGGVGLVEGGMAGSLMAFGTDPAIATVTTVTYRLLAYWFPLLVAALPAAVVVRRAWTSQPDPRPRVHGTAMRGRR